MSEHDDSQPQSHIPEPDPRLKGIDYKENATVHEIHDSILREKSDPQDGMEPMPLWLISLVLVVVLVCGYYLGQYNGGFSGTAFDERGSASLAAKTGAAGGGAAVVDENSPEALAKLGKRVYTTNCASCHTPTGLGVSGQYPPLVASSWVLEKPYHLVALVLHGLQGEIIVNGNKYNNAMPAWGKQLNDRQMAAVLTYIRTEWGNQASPISPAQVAAVRKETEAQKDAYTAATLDKLPTELIAAP